MSVHAGESANGGLGQLLNTIQMIEDHAGMSLTQYVRRSMINSRVFIEQSLAGEEIMNLYVGFVTTAMGMNQYISNTQRVRDIMNVVATESFEAKPIDVGAEMTAYFASFDNSAVIDESYTGEAKVVSPEYKDPTLPSGRIIKVDFDVAGNKFSINMFLQLQPTFIPSEVAKQFIQMNFTPSLRQRWMQVSAGEISMINDLILGPG